jgi:hypothetical protein
LTTVNLIKIKSLFEFDVVDIRFGSKADIGGSLANVCFTPNSGHRISAAKCPLCAKSRHPVAPTHFR